jgi:hypothetical protein
VTYLPLYLCVSPTTTAAAASGVEEEEGAKPPPPIEEEELDDSGAEAPQPPGCVEACGGGAVALCAYRWLRTTCCGRGRQVGTPLNPEPEETLTAASPPPPATPPMPPTPQ